VQYSIARNLLKIIVSPLLHLNSCWCRKLFLKVFFQYFFIVERVFYTLNILVFFVAFTRHQYNVARLGKTNGCLDRLLPVFNSQRLAYIVAL